MGKKCIPGIICVENMTLFIFIIVAFIVIYLYFAKSSASNIYIVSPTNMPSTNMPSINTPSTNMVYGQRQDTINDVYAPPLKNDGIFFPIDSGDIRGQPAVPINVQTRGYSGFYSQIGILTRTNGGDMILPLMGRRIMNGRNKLQYYTISNTGNLNTKLPIKVNGKSCSGEYGCDEINNGDVVYTEGYNDTFKATVYENGLFSYIPVL